MAMTTCKECKAQISTTAEACPQCGAKPTKTSGCAMIVAAFFGLFVLSAIVRGCSGDTSPTTSATQAPASSSPSSDSATTPPTSTTKTDPAIVLAESKKTVDEIESRLKENAESLKKYYGTPEKIKQATADLIRLAVVKGLYEESKDKDEKSLSNKANSLIPKVSQQQRMIYASTAEEIFVKNGMNIKVSATGANKDQLRLKYALMSQPLVYKFQNEIKINDQASNLGFKKIIYTNGFDSSLGETWTVDL